MINNKNICRKLTIVLFLLLVILGSVYGGPQQEVSSPGSRIRNHSDNTVTEQESSVQSEHEVPIQEITVQDDAVPAGSVFSQTEYFTIPEIPFPVRFAVDEESLSWRTGEIDPAVAEVPRKIEQLLVSSPADGIQELALFLKNDGGSAGPSINDFHLAKRIHDWVTSVMAYDSLSARGRTSFESSQDPYVFLTFPDGPYAICRGFADLFLYIALEAGLDAKRVSGVCRTYWATTVDRYGRHAWNAVKINGNWYIIDISANRRATFDGTERTETGHYRDRWLFASPESMLFVYRADNEDEQFIENPIDYNSFIEMPMFYIGMMEWGVTCLSTDIVETREIFTEKNYRRDNFYDLYESSDEIWEMQFSVPQGYEIYAYLMDKDGNQLDNRTFTTFQTNQYGDYIVNISVAPPDQGQYMVNIRGRSQVLEPSSSVYTFYLNQTGPAGDLLPESGTFYPTMRSEQYDVSFENVTKSGNYYSFECKFGPDVEIYQGVIDTEGNAVQTSLVHTKSGEFSRMYHFSPPAEGTWLIRMYAREKDSGNNLDRVTFLRIDADAAAPEGFPFYMPRYKDLFFEYDLKIIQDLSPVPGTDRLYSVILEIPEELETRIYIMECDSERKSLKDAEDNWVFAKGHWSFKREGNQVEYFFSPGDAMSSDHVYRVRMYLRINNTNENVLEYLIPAGEGPGDLAP